MAFADTAKRTVVSGIGPVKVTLAGTVYEGDPIGYSSGWYQAIASTSAPIAAMLVAGEDGVAGDVITAYQAAVLWGPTGGTAGNLMFLSSTAGKYAESGNGSARQVVGVMSSATEISVTPAHPYGPMIVANSTADTRAVYAKLFLATAAGSGDAVRANAEVIGVAAANAFGLHSTAKLAADGTITGLMNGVRATLEVAAASRSLSGTFAALQVDSYIGAGNTMPAGTTSFIRVADVGSVRIGALLDLADISDGSGGLFSAHVTQTMTHSIKILYEGTAYYIMCTNAATNRT